MNRYPTKYNISQCQVTQASLHSVGLHIPLPRLKQFLRDNQYPYFLAEFQLK